MLQKCITWTMLILFKWLKLTLFIEIIVLEKSKVKFFCFCTNKLLMVEHNALRARLDWEGKEGSGEELTKNRLILGQIYSTTHPSPSIQMGHKAETSYRSAWGHVMWRSNFAFSIFYLFFINFFYYYPKYHINLFLLLPH